MSADKKSPANKGWPQWPERDDSQARFARSLEMSDDCNPVAVRFGKNVRHYRELAGYSQEDLALLSYLPRPAVGLLEEGEHEPLVGTVICLAHGLVVSIDDLLQGIRLEVDRFGIDLPDSDLFTE